MHGFQHVQDVLGGAPVDEREVSRVPAPVIFGVEPGEEKVSSPAGMGTVAGRNADQTMESLVGRRIRDNWLHGCSPEQQDGNNGDLSEKGVGRQAVWPELTPGIGG